MTIAQINNKNELAVYARSKLEPLLKEHEQFVKSSYAFKKEFSEEEYNQMIQKLEESILNIPEKYRASNELKQAYINDCKHEIELLKRDMNRMIDFKFFIQDQEKKFLSYPLSMNDVLVNVKKYINEQVSYYQKDIIDCYFEMFVDKVNEMCPKDKNYIKTIESVYRNKNSRKAMDILNKFFDTLTNSLIEIVMRFSNVVSNKYFEIEKLLKSQCRKLIDKMHYVIYNFIRMKIDYIDGDEMNDSRSVKIYAETCMSQLNKTMIDELPELLNDEFTEKMEYITKDTEIRWNNLIGSLTVAKCIENDKSTTVVEILDQPVVATKVLIEKEEPNFESFMKILPNGTIEINQLVSMYNNYFGTNITCRGISQMKKIKENFTVLKKCINRKTITFYQMK